MQQDSHNSYVPNIRNVCLVIILVIFMNKNIKSTLTDYDKCLIKQNINDAVDNQYELLEYYLLLKQNKINYKDGVTNTSTKSFKNSMKKYTDEEKNIFNKIKKNNKLVKSSSIELKNDEINKCEINKCEINKFNKTWVDYFNNDVDKIFVINLENRLDRKERILKQFKKFKITNFEFVKAVNGYDPALDLYYMKFYSNCEKDDQSFSKGALGCLMSHIKCIELAIEREYNKVLILEDDALFDLKLGKLPYTDISKPWQLLYLGKKNMDNKPLVLINDMWCLPQLCYASHMWLIDKSIFKLLLKKYLTFEKPVDMIVSELSRQKELGIYALKNDLAITGLQSDLKGDSNINKWAWDFKRFYPENPKYIKRIVIWGFNNSQIGHPQHDVHKKIYLYLKKSYGMYIKVNFCDDVKESYESTIYICSPYHGQCHNLPIRDDSLYVFHLGEDSDLEPHVTKFSMEPNIDNLYKEHRAISLLSKPCKSLSLVKRKYSENIKNKTLKLDFCANDVGVDYFVDRLFDFFRRKNDCFEIPSLR